MRALLGAVVALMLVAGSPFLADAGAAEDTMITTKVKTKLTTDRVKNLVSVNVDTKDGVVHLKGTVPNGQAKAEAERLAKDTDGVLSVTNDIKVSPETVDCRLAEPRLATGCAPGTPVAVESLLINLRAAAGARRRPIR